MRTTPDAFFLPAFRTIRTFCHFSTTAITSPGSLVTPILARPALSKRAGSDAEIAGFLAGAAVTS